ncbi:MAG: serine/threonine-protein kinase [Polyangiaceae bacterium]
MRSGDLVGGRFRIESLAGTGGMGSVWKAIDQETSAVVALKLLHGRDPRDTARFLREAEIIATLAHPAIVRYVADGKSVENDRYLVMEWLEGESLAERIERERLTLAESLAMIHRAADALGAMHAHQLVHRDLKPSNLFLEGKDPARVKVIDLGIARRANRPEVTRTGVLLGTPGYIAPEQALGDRGVDARADVFALGCVLFKCITGEGAFGTEDDLTVLLRVVKGVARRAREIVPKLPAEIDETLAWMLSRDPDDRPRDAAVAASALARLATIYGDARPGDDPLDDQITTKTRAVSYSLEDPVLGKTSPFPLTVPRIARPVEIDADPTRDETSGVIELLSPDDLEEVRTDPGHSDASRGFAASVARAIHAAESARPSEHASMPVSMPVSAPVSTSASMPVSAPAPASMPVAPPASMPVADPPAPAPQPPPAPDPPDPLVLSYLRAAETFLQQNDFRNALLQARRGVDAGAQGQLLGSLRAREAEAHRWRGERGDAERAASEALTSLPEGTELWLMAAREAVLAAGARGDAARVGELAEQIMRVLPGASPSGISVGTLATTTTFLMHAGQGALVQRFLRWVDPFIANIDKEPPAIAAYLHQMRALRALNEGDLGAYLAAVEAAAEQFAAVPDQRSSLAQRVNAGFARIELGAFAEAESDLRATITGAERLGLNNVVLAARANLAVAQGRLGQHEPARTLMLEVLKESVSAGDRRLEASARTELALILLASGDLTGALREAKAAVELTAAHAPARVLALGILSRAQLAHDRPMAALEAAEQAIDLLHTTFGVEQGESLVRLAFAEARHHTGDHDGARDAIDAARRRLASRARRLEDPAHRDTFLRAVAENAETLRLAGQWLGEPAELPS